jgi:hypothetical protein
VAVDQEVRSSEMTSLESTYNVPFQKYQELGRQDSTNPTVSVAQRLLAL